MAGTVSRDSLANGTPPTKRFLSTRWCASTLGPNRWIGPPRNPDITPLGLFLLRLCKGPGIPFKSWYCGCSCFFDTPDAGKNMA
ncbi:hypothetical protein L798_15623 [Zootermopsis nevadensis]|uniref:Uncharacterized protein n=1 Tax=Zootermopsis nevadensis TaxID=136037 RepID=A0A067QXY8_ZOONE|nr:hypothetical protein L798_15623 [Zootermopsis nevadensis]